jgi:hypothetical protein
MSSFDSHVSRARGGQNGPASPSDRTAGRCASDAASGFALPEALIALALALLALLLGAAVAFQVPAAARRLDAQNRADRALEAALEGLRAGQLPLRTGVAAPLLAPIALAGEPPPAVWLEVERTEIPDLYLVVARATYLVAEAPRERVVTTRVWRP